MSMAMAYAMKKRMAKGGQVKPKEGGAKFDFKHRMNNEKGVHQRHGDLADQGMSGAGADVRDVHDQKAKYGESDPEARESATQVHHEKLAELRSMPNPKLKGLAHGGKVGKHADNHAYNYDDSQSVKGVNKVMPRYVTGKGVEHGTSEAGAMAKKAGTNGDFSEGARKRHHQTLSEMRAMPAPKLKGLAHGGKVRSNFDRSKAEAQHELQQRGVHRGMKADDDVLKSYRVDPKEHAMRVHTQILEEGRAIHPKLKGLAKGGEVYQSECTEHCQSPCEIHPQADDMVSRIMRSRYAKGGEVMADFDKNDFDYMDQHEPLEFHDTAQNSGDELGENMVDDMVSRIMKKRRA